jgi:predicted ATPase
LRHPQTLLYALSIAALLNLLRCDESSALEKLEDLISLALEQKFPAWIPMANIMRGQALTARGQTTEGVALASQGYTDKMAGGQLLNLTFYLALLAQSCERADRNEEAFEYLVSALQTADKTGECWFQAELHRLQGAWLIANRPNEQAQAEACFRRAISVAQEQNARMWELRVATSLARLWRDNGKDDEANNLLSAIYAWFTEGFDDPDLQDARTLLNELRYTAK